MSVLFQITFYTTCVWSRTDVNFDFGWRHRLGATRKPLPPPPVTPPVGCTGKHAFKTMKGQCIGLSSYAAASTAKECEAHCCGCVLFLACYRIF